MTPSADRPDRPWRPTQFRVSGVYKRTQQVWVTDRRTGERVRRRVARFDVRYRVDGHQFSYTFEQRGWADSFARRLHEAFADGRLFDPHSRQFTDPPEDKEPGGERAVSFFDVAVEYVARKWRGWEPASRRNAQRDIARACLLLATDDAPTLSADEVVAADRWLRSHALMPDDTNTDDTDGPWEAWFARWSLPLAHVTDNHLHAFIEYVRTHDLTGQPRTLAASSVRRARAVVRAVFTHARKRRLLEWDPWEAVDPEPTADDGINPDLVMTPTQLRALAAACATVDPRYVAFVLTQGLCGLRPGEGVALRRRDLHLTATPATITARGTHSAVPDKYFLKGEDRRRPLKGRSVHSSRVIPVPGELVSVLRRHLDRWAQPDPGGVVFTNTQGGRVDLSNFQRDVWNAARHVTFPSSSPLQSVRLHDLRHAAITGWLNAGVPLKTAQAWSGHKTLSVLLDTYLGVMHGDTQVGLARWEQALAADEPPDPFAH